MCGIAGFLGACNDVTSTLNKMVSVIEHRGPDAQNQWIDQNSSIALGHSRLAVVDLAETGAQPMFSHSGRYVVSYNGEIYNHLDIRKKLNLHDPFIKWKGTSDTETLAIGFDLLGIENTLNDCIGMFAVAVWDKQDQVLTLIRDRFGEKPLYFQPTKNGVIFGSEISVIEQHSECTKEISNVAVKELLETDCIPAPLSLYRGVFKLLPGSIIRFDSNGFLNTRQWWSPIESALKNSASQKGSEQDMLKELEQRLNDSVKRQMMADVPLGAFLSGGIDSSLITALMQENGSTPVKTFSIGFEDKQYDESVYAAQVAHHLGTEHTEHRVSDKDIFNLIPKMAAVYSEPFADVSQIPTYLVSQMSRKDVTVALTGDAGDEIFAGYSRHTFTYNDWPKYKKIPKPIRNLGVRAINSMDEKTLDQIFSYLPATSNWSRVGEKLKRAGHVLGANNLNELHQFSTRRFEHCKLLEKTTFETTTANKIKTEELGPQSELVQAMNSSLDQAEVSLNEMRWLMLKDQTDYLPNDILAKVDRASMACSLETRAPFLDHTLTEFAQSISSEFLVSGTKGKQPLRKILSQYIPPEMIDRPKMGFAIPVHDILREDLKDWAASLLTKTALEKTNQFNSQQVENLWVEHSSGSNHIKALWPILMFQSWSLEHQSL